MNKNGNYFYKIFFIFHVLLSGCSDVYSKTLESEDLQKIFKNAQSLAKENKGYPCYSTEDMDKEVLGWFIKADVADISSYEYPPSWANRNEKDMLSIIVHLKDDKRAVFTVDIKLINKDIECYDLDRIYF